MLHKEVIEEYLNPYFLKDKKEYVTIDRPNKDFIIQFFSPQGNLKPEFKVHLFFKSGESEEEDSEILNYVPPIESTDLPVQISENSKQIAKIW